MSRSVEMIVIESDDEDDSKPTAATSRSERRERPRSSRFSVPHDLIRDGIVYVQENYYFFFRHFLDQVNYHGRKRKGDLLKLKELIEDATPAEKSRIMLPRELEHARSRLLYCELVIEGLPSGVFFGSGFGAKSHEARASAAKDLSDKCLKLGIFTRELCETASLMDGKAKIRIPHMRPAGEAIINICDFMGRELWPSDVMTARELEPIVIERLKKLFDKAIRRAYEKIPEHPMNQRDVPPSVGHIRDYPSSSQQMGISSSQRCIHCQEYGHSLERCTLLIQQMEMKKRQAAIKSPAKPAVPRFVGGTKPVNLPYNGSLTQDLRASQILNRQPVSVDFYGLPMMQQQSPFIPPVIVPQSASQIVPTTHVFTELEIRRRVEAELKEKERILEEQIREKILREEKDNLERRLREEKELVERNKMMTSSTFGATITNPSQFGAATYAEKNMLPSTTFGATTAYSAASNPAKPPQNYNPHAAIPILNAYANFGAPKQEEKVMWTSRKGVNGYGLGTAFGLVREGNQFVKQGLMWLSPGDPIHKIQRIATDCEETLEILERRVETVSDAEMLESLMQAVSELGEQARVMTEQQQVGMLTQLQQLLNQALEEKRKKVESGSASTSSRSQRDRSTERDWRGSRRYERRNGDERRMRSRSRSPQFGHRQGVFDDPVQRVSVMIDGKEVVLLPVSSKEHVKADEKFLAQDFKSGKWESCRLLKVLSPIHDEAAPRLLLRLPNGIRWKRQFSEIFREQRY
ncbi:unnamed protein product, partial [Mesorhabditis belari]|uniref:Uncharacterized protein n=1 Tax=Mesorhabditis belari TaxID=2138241 RepID=A0AAF3FUH9_9BILA